MLQSLFVSFAQSSQDIDSYRSSPHGNEDSSSVAHHSCPVCNTQPTMAYLSKSSGGRTDSHLQVNVPEGDWGEQKYTSLV